MTKIFKETKVLLRNIPALLVALLIASVICMNLLANKSIDLGLDWLALDCGIFFSWIAFLTMDVVTRRYGQRAANILTVVALLVNLLVALIFLIVSLVPGTWSQSYVEGSETLINGALDKTIASSWYVIMGSSVAFVVSAFLNNFLHFLIARSIKKSNFIAFGVSSYASTFIAQFVDNLLFALIVSLHFFGWNIVQCLTCAVTGAVAELLCEVAFSPVGYAVVKDLEKHDVGREYLDLVAQHKELKEKKKAEKTENKAK